MNPEPAMTSPGVKNIDTRDFCLGKYYNKTSVVPLLETEVWMKQKRIVSCLLFAFMMSALVAAGFAKDELVKSQWIATPPSIDGMNTDFLDLLNLR